MVRSSAAAILRSITSANLVARIDRQVAGVGPLRNPIDIAGVRADISLILASGKLLALQNAYISIRAV